MKESEARLLAMKENAKGRSWLQHQYVPPKLKGRTSGTVRPSVSLLPLFLSCLVGCIVQPGIAACHIHSNVTETRGSQWTWHTLARQDNGRRMVAPMEGLGGGFDVTTLQTPLRCVYNSSLTRRGSCEVWNRCWKFYRNTSHLSPIFSKKRQMLLTKEREWNKRRSYWNEVKLKTTTATISI